MTTFRWTVGLLALHWGMSLLLWPTLPAEVPVAVTDAGETVEEAISPVSWFGLPLLSLLVVGGFHLGARWLTGRSLAGLQFPALLVGGEAARSRDEEAIKAALRRKAAAASLVLSVAIFLIHVGVYQAIRQEGGMPWMLAGIFVSMLVLPAVLVMGSRREPRRIDLGPRQGPDGPDPW